jgi:hypothetical protein
MSRYQATKTFRDSGFNPPVPRKPGEKYDSPAGAGHVAKGRAIELNDTKAPAKREATGAPGARPSPAGRAGRAASRSSSRQAQAPRKKK